VTFSKSHWKKKKDPVKLYLRIRTVEWQVSERYFECVADETFAREPVFELQEVRGSPRIETHFVELQKTFEYLGFDVSTDMNAIVGGLQRMADGTEIGSREDYFDPRESFSSVQSFCLYPILNRDGNSITCLGGRGLSITVLLPRDDSSTHLVTHFRPVLRSLHESLRDPIDHDIDGMKKALLDP
jgi:hypothetical protein